MTEPDFGVTKDLVSAATSEVALARPDLDAEELRRLAGLARSKARRLVAADPKTPFWRQAGQLSEELLAGLGAAVENPASGARSTSDGDTGGDHAAGDAEWTTADMDHVYELFQAHPAEAWQSLAALDCAQHLDLVESLCHRLAAAHRNQRRHP
jgi:hypothetical protein